MKLVFLAFGNIRYLPFLNFYIDQCDLLKNEAHLVYWNREMHTDAPVPKGLIPHSFEDRLTDNIPAYKKTASFARYGHYAKKIIRDVKPDKIVVMYASTAITVFRLLTGKYKNKYIFDYRDVSYEKNSFYRKIVGRIVKNSNLTFTSSDGFRIFLPDVDNKIFTSHNLQRKTLAVHDSYKLKEYREDGMPVRISMWGLLRHLNINKSIIEKLGADSRFELHYYGKASESFTEMLKGYPNVFYHGEYMPDDVDGFAKNTDMLLNIYDNNNVTMPYAMANKFYDGLLYYIPQLCTKDSFMGKRCEELGVGMACEPYSEALADSLYSYYKSLDRRIFTENCDNALREIMEQVEYGEKLIRQFFEGE